MASTFELSSQYYGTRHLKLVCSQTTDISTNTSTIAWTLYSEGGSSDYYTTGPTSVYINGTRVYYKDVVYYDEGIFPAKKGSVSGTTTVPHLNDGTKTITVSITTAIYYSSTETKSGSWTLNSIPRYATLSVSNSSKTETTAVMAWTADATCDRLYYSTNNGSSFTQVTIAEATSGSFTITGLSANTTYNIKVKVRRKDSQLETTSDAISVTTYAYPYATGMPDFTLGNQVEITIYNPLSRSVSVQMQTNAGTANGSINTSGTKVKGWAGSSNISTFYASIPNATYANYKIAVIYGSHTETRTGGKYSIDATACTPTIGSVTYQDSNASTVAVTGDDQKIVQNQSTVSYTASSISTKNSATIDSVTIKVNGSTHTMTVSGTSATYSGGTIDSSSSVTATVTVTDSRGLTGSKNVTISMYEWKLPTGIITMQREYNYYTPTTIKCDAQYSYLGGHNTISISYAFTKDGESTATITGTLSDNVAVTVNIDNQFGWSAKYTLTDAFGTTIYNLRLERGQPIVFFDRLRTSTGFGTFPDANNSVVLSTDTNLHAKGNNNIMEYMPYSAIVVGSGSDAYLRIASVTAYSTWTYGSILFDVRRTYDSFPVRLALYYETGSGTTPTTVSFRYDSYRGTYINKPFNAFITQSGSTIDVYVAKCTTGSERMVVTTYLSAYQVNHSTVTYPAGQLASIPSGAIMVTPMPCLTPTVTITKTSGDSTASGVAFERYGNVCHLSFNIATTASISVGSNAFVGTTTAPKPITAQTNASYYGSSVIITDFGASGTITVRVNGASLASGATAYCNVIYLTNE